MVGDGPTAPAADPLPSERLRSGLVWAGGSLAIAALAFLYPLALDALLDRFGVRIVSVLLFAIVILTSPLRCRAVGSGSAAAVGFAMLLLGAAVLDDRRILRLLPACVYVGLAWVFGASLRGPQSLVERGARLLVPEAPPFIGGYCRSVTAAWSACFVLVAAAIVWLAFTGSPDAWRTFTGRDVWIGIAALMALEFFVRKTWFRAYFRGGPFERFWSSLFPAEHTERGRRSLEYIRRYREQLRAAERRPDE